MPADFPEMFVLLGHKTIEDHYETGIDCVKRWMQEWGEAELIQLRRGYLRKVAAAAGRTKAGGRFPGKRFGLVEMAASDPALAYMPIRRAHRPWRKEIWIRMPGDRPKPQPYG